MSMRTTIELGSADLLMATQANILPRTFSADAPHVVVTSTSGSMRPTAIAASNPLRFMNSAPSDRSRGSVQQEQFQRSIRRASAESIDFSRATTGMNRDGARSGLAVT